MYFKIIKASLDGLCGGESHYESIDEVLKELHYCKGWDSKKQMGKASRPR